MSRGKDMDKAEPLYGRMHKQSNKTPEKRLWEAVLLTWLMEAQGDYNKYKNSMNGHRGVFYLAVNDHINHVKNPHAEFCCEMAGIHYKSFRDKVLNICEGIDSVDIKSLYY